MSTAPDTEPQPDPERDALVLFGAQIGRDTALYTIGTAMVLPFSLITVAVLTRFLDPAEYGRLALAFVFASLLTTLYNIGSLQGIFMWVFGSAGEDIGVAPAGGAPEGTKRRALGTGALITVGIVFAATVPLLIFAEPLGGLLFDREGEASVVRWATASAALGSLWRLTLNVLRMERRANAFTVMSAVRPALVLSASVALVASGHGVAGAIAGTALGTAVAALACVGLSRRSYSIRFDSGDARQILSLGARFVPVIAGLWVVHNADVFLLSRYVPESEVGLYRLAGRVAALVSYVASAFLMAWVALEATSVVQAAYRRAGRGPLRGHLVTYYWVGALTLVLAMAVSADVLVQIAAPGYADAAPLIAPIGLGFVLYSFFIVLVRAARIERRYWAYGGMACVCAVAFVGLSLLLIPWLESYGAALSVVFAMALGCAVFMVLIARSDSPVPFDYAGMTMALVLAVACWAIARWAGPSDGVGHAVIEAGAFFGFVGLLVPLRIVPAQHLRPLGRIARAAVRPRVGATASLARLPAIDPRDRLVVEAIVRDRLSGERAAAQLGMPEQEVATRLVRALRELEGRSGPSDSHADAEIGAYLLSTDPPAERDAIARRLWDEGVDPLDLHELESALSTARRAPRKVWAQATAEVTA